MLLSSIGLEGEFHPLNCLSFVDDLKGLGYTAIRVSSGRGHVDVGFVADTSLAIGRRRGEFVSFF